MSAEERREAADNYLGHPGFASREDEGRRRCPVDGGYLDSDEVCEFCGLSRSYGEDAARDVQGRAWGRAFQPDDPERPYSLLAAHKDGNPAEWARFTDAWFALDVKAALTARYPRVDHAPTFVVLDRRNPERYVTEEDFA